MHECVEESLGLLNCKWFTVHKNKCVKSIENIKQLCASNKKSPSMPRKTWSSMNIDEKDLWRQAIMAYNTVTYLKKSEQKIKENPEEIKKKLKITKQFRTWELIRMYIHQAKINKMKFNFDS